MKDSEIAVKLITTKDPRSKPSISKWEEYQHFMQFIMEYLPSIKTRRRETIVLRRRTEINETNGYSREFYDFVPQDYVESLVRRFLDLPTVQQSRRELDQAVKEIQERARHE